jgi:hypothetical protein
LWFEIKFLSCLHRWLIELDNDDRESFLLAALSLQDVVTSYSHTFLIGWGFGSLIWKSSLNPFNCFVIFFFNFKSSPDQENYVIGLNYFVW